MTPKGSVNMSNTWLHLTFEESKWEWNVHLVVKLWIPLFVFSCLFKSSFYVILSCKKLPIGKVWNLLLSLRASAEYDWWKPACTAETVMAHRTLLFLAQPLLVRRAGNGIICSLSIIYLPKWELPKIFLNPCFPLMQPLVMACFFALLSGSLLICFMTFVLSQ